MRQLVDLAPFTPHFRVVMGEIGPRREISTKAHRNGSGDDLGNAGHNHKPVGDTRPGEARRKCKRHGEPVRHSDHDVADGLRAQKVAFMMRCCRHQAVSEKSLESAALIC